MYESTDGWPAGGGTTLSSSRLEGEYARASGLECDGKAYAEGVAASGVPPGTMWRVIGG
jgi:hypothetical protein